MFCWIKEKLHVSFNLQQKRISLQTERQGQHNNNNTLHHLCSADTEESNNASEDVGCFQAGRHFVSVQVLL